MGSLVLCPCVKQVQKTPTAAEYIFKIMCCRSCVQMTGFSWTALTLSLLLFAGNSFAVDQNELAKIVDAIWEK